jgi:hypothetical protein
MPGLDPASNNLVHLGPGQEKYLDGWINVDANLVSPKPDILAKSFLCELAEKAGFQDVKVVMPRETNYPEKISDEVLAFEEEVTNKLVMTVLIEAKKPCSIRRLPGKCLRPMK